MHKLPKLLLGSLFLIFYFISPDDAEAAVIASQTASYANLGTTWAFSQDLGNNLSGNAGSITLRITTSSTIDLLAQNSYLVDITNSYQVVTRGCTTFGVASSNPKRFLTITTGGNVPA